MEEKDDDLVRKLHKQGYGKKQIQQEITNNLAKNMFSSSTEKTGVTLEKQKKGLIKRFLDWLRKMIN